MEFASGLLRARMPRGVTRGPLITTPPEGGRGNRQGGQEENADSRGMPLSLGGNSEARAEDGGGQPVTGEVEKPGSPAGHAKYANDRNWATNPPSGLPVSPAP